MIEINYRDSRPIYEQIKDGIKGDIVSGVIKRDEKIPSVRDYASTLAINPNTIAKAIKELEQEGYIYTVKGRGSFASDASQISAQKKEVLLQRFDEIAKELLFLQTSKEELQKRIAAVGGESDD